MTPRGRRLKPTPPAQAAGAAPPQQGLWRRIYERLLPYWKAWTTAIALLAIAAATQPTLAVIMKPLLDEGFSGGQPSYIWSIPLAVIGLIFLRGVCNYASSYLMAWSANNMLLILRGHMFSRLLALPDEAFRRGDTGRLMNRFTIDAGNVTGLATEVITVLVRETLIVVALLGVLLYMSWQLTLIVLVILPVSVLIAQVFIRRLRRINRDTISMNAELTRVVRQAIDGQRVIKLFDGQQHEQERFAYVNARLRRFAMRATSADAAMSPLTQQMIAFAVAAVIAAALYQAQNHGLTVGSFAAFMAALGQIFDPVRRLTKIASPMQRMLVAAESVFAMLDQDVEADDGRQSLPRPVRGQVRFEQVSHRYPGAHQDVLSDISFTVEPGETVALVGRSGSGKTTLANMLPRFITPSSGHVRIDGVDLREVPLREVRAQLSLVSQDVVLFDGTIAANVAYGALHDVTPGEIQAALAAADLAGFIDGLPQGIDAPVGENANQLSGGQRQRLAIARALVKNAPILILDEATSALDNVSEAQVQASLERLMAGRTTLVIAHRLSTVQRADRIIVLDGGRIVEQGRHDELLAANGAYTALYHSQLQASPERDAD